MSAEPKAEEVVSRRVVLTLLPSALWAVPLARAQTPRTALVIGNSGYRSSRLKSAVEDARAVAKLLAGIGYSVTAEYDVRRDDLIEAMKAFVSKSRASPVRLFYYSGHGIQFKNQNYLVAIDSDPKDEGEIPARCPSFSGLVDSLDSDVDHANICILDACRINPFAQVVVVDPDGRQHQVSALRGIGDGLRAMIPRPPTGTFVAFAAAPGKASFEPKSGHSYFTKHLLANMRVPGLPIGDVFERVRRAVLAETNGKQRPWDQSSLDSKVCFVPSSSGRCGR